MKQIIKFFLNQTEIILQDSYQFDCRKKPDRLLKQINPQSPQNNITYFKTQIIQKSKQSSLKLMKCLSVLHLLIITSTKNYGLVESLLPLFDEKSDKLEFLEKTYLINYQRFLIKCCCQQERHIQIRNIFNSNPEEFNNFQSLYYYRNILIQLLESLSKIATLGRYYLDKHQKIVNMFVKIAAIDAVAIYNKIRIILNGILTKSGDAQTPVEKKVLVVSFIEDQISEISGQMRRLLLNKYFNLTESGIYTKMYRCQDQSQKILQTMNKFLEDKNLQKLRKSDLKSLSRSKSKAKPSGSLSKSQAQLTKNFGKSQPTLTKSNSTVSIHGIKTPLTPIKSVISVNKGQFRKDICSNNSPVTKEAKGFRIERQTNTDKTKSIQLNRVLNYKKKLIEQS